jgi:xanthine dehydrogenase YagS FAD-binding subunit
MKDGQSMAKAGDNRYHAIFGNSGPACFVNPSSLAPALIALGATVGIFGPSGERTTAVEHFFKIPTEEGEKEYDLKNGEVLTSILVPPSRGKVSAVYEVRQREALDWPLSAAAVTLELNGNTIVSARVVLGHVAPIPWVSPSASEALVGKVLSEETATAAGQAAVREAAPLSHNRHKVQLAQVAVQRALLRAGGMEVS